MIFGAILFLGALVRFVYMAVPESKLTPDEATYGLAALHILRGERPTFYYAQPYTGTLSAYLSAILISIFDPHPLTLKIIPFLFSVGFIFLNYKLALAIFKKEAVGLLAALLSAVPPSFWANWSSRAGSGYPEALFIGNLLFLLTIKIIYQGLSPKKPLRLYFLFGFLAGLGFWIQPAIVYYLAPAAILLFFWRPLLFLSKDFYALLLGAVLGAAPVIAYNLSHDWLTQRMLFHKPGGTKAAFLNFFLEGIPKIIGTRTPHARTDLLPPLAFAVYGIYIAAFTLLLKERLRWILDMLTLRFFSTGKLKISLAFSEPRDLLLLFSFCLPVIFALSPFNWYLDEPRYIQPLFTFFPTLLGYFIFRVFQRSRLLGAALLILVVFNNGYTLFAPGPYTRPKTFLKQYRTAKVIKFLKDYGVSFVNTSSNLAHRLIFESGEEIIASPMERDFTALRYPAYIDMISKAPKEKRGYVFIKGEHSIQTESCKEDLSQQDGPCKEYLVDEIFRVYTFR